MSDLLPRRLTRKSLDAFVAERFEGKHSALLTGISDHMNQVMRSDLRGARSFARRVESMIPLLSGTDRAMTLRIVARYHHLSGRTAKSLGLYRQAAMMYKDAGDDVAMARIGRAMVDALMYTGRYTEAEQTGRDAILIFKRRGLDMDRAQTLCNIGNVHHRQDNNPAALNAYNQALEIIRLSQTPLALALVQFNRGNILTNLHRLNEAESCYVESRSLYAELGMELAEAQAEYSLAYLRFLRGRITESLGAFEQVLTKFERLGDQRGCAQTHLDMLEIRLQMNLFNAVEVGARDVIARFRLLGMRYEQAKCWYFLAKARAALEDLAGARAAIKAAHNLVRQERNGAWDGSVQLLESRLLMLAGRLKESRKLAAGALRSFDRAGDVRRRTAAILTLADLDIHEGQLLRSHKRLIPILRNQSHYPTSTMFEAHWLRARIHRLRGETDLAVASYEQALDAAERMVDGLPPDETRVFFLSDKLAMYHELTAVFLHQRDYGGALRVLEQSRQLRRSSYRRATTAVPASVPKALLEKQESLRSRLHQLYGFPASLERFAAVSVGLVRKTEDELWSLVQRSRRFLPSKQPGPRARDPIKDHTRIASGRSVIIFASEGDYPGALILSGSRTTYRRLPVTWDQLEALIGRLYFFIEKNRIPGAFRPHREHDVIQNTRNQLGALSEAVLWPLLTDLSESADLTIVPLDSLGAVPFHALPLPDGRPLYLAHTVRNAVDMTEALHAQPARLAPASVGAIFSPGTDGTKAMDAEAAEIGELFPHSRHQSGRDSSRQSFRDALSGPADFLHIASHASAAIDNPMFSEILLNDGPFYAFDLFDQPVNQQLVTLAACQTGRPGVLHAGQAYGLAEAFIGQGARAVLSSLWTVDDQLTRVFMVEFYRNLRNGEGVHRSWTGAMTRLRESNENPYNWAPFVLIGMTS
jgi:tetratricopeptide (TPR) repeat protein